MRDRRHSFPIAVHTRWIDYSPAHRDHTLSRVRSQLVGFASALRAVDVRISDDDPRNVASRRCEIQVLTVDARRISASSVGTDLFTIVDGALEALLEQLRRPASMELTGEWPRSAA